jgi:nitronate monooxygenase
MVEVLAPIHKRWGLAAPALPQSFMPSFAEQMEAILSDPPAAFSFTFGIPPSKYLDALRDRGVVVLGTATTAREAVLLADAGVDAAIAQGAEAGGHRGTFAAPFEDAMVPLLDLVRQTRAAMDLPIIASGGIMTGQDIAECVRAGAVAAQIGTAYLACPECGASPAYKAAVLAAQIDITTITRAFSGRPARGLRNGFIQQLDDREEIILPYPVQNALTRPMRTEAAKRGEADYLSLWAGTGVAGVRQMSAAELTKLLIGEYGASMAGRRCSSDSQSGS